MSKMIHVRDVPDFVHCTLKARAARDAEMVATDTAGETDP
jgi:plasmid stability protein